MEQLLNIEDVAERLRVSKSFLYKLVESKSIPTVRIGNRILFRPTAVADWLNRQSTTVEAS